MSGLVSALLNDDDAKWVKAQFTTRNDINTHIKSVLEGCNSLTGQAVFRIKLDKSTLDYWKKRGLELTWVRQVKGRGDDLLSETYSYRFFQ